jgi:hypothetical protein
MKIDPDAPAFPWEDINHRTGQHRTGQPSASAGLSIRAHFASLAMQRMAGNPAIIGPNPMCGVAYVNGSPETLAQMAIQQADALIAELNKEATKS